ncbi:hypothetical protein RFI_17739, partial [Reticulomyxa filosa]
QWVIGKPLQLEVNAVFPSNCSQIVSLEFQWLVFDYLVFVNTTYFIYTCIHTFFFFFGGGEKKGWVLLKMDLGPSLNIQVKIGKYSFVAMSLENSVFAMTTSNSFDVEIVSSGILARIPGGNRQLWYGEALTLDGSLQSRDWNETDGVVGSLLFEWQLLVDGYLQEEIANNSAYLNFSWPKFLSNESTLHIPSLTMVPEHTYTWILILTDPTESTRMNMDSVDIHVVTRPLSISISTTQSQLYSSSPIYLYAVATCHSCRVVSWQWTETSALLSAYTWSTKEIQNSSILIIPESTLTDGTLYTFECNVTVQNISEPGSLFSGKASLGFVATPRPVVGAVLVTPSSGGVALITDFTVAVVHVYGSYGPYTFTLTYQQNGGAEQLLVGNTSSLSLSGLKLPDGQITLWAYATDLYGGIGKNVVVFTVAPANAGNGTTNICDDLQQSVQSNLQQNIALKAYQSVAASNSFLTKPEINKNKNNNNNNNNNNMKRQYRRPQQHWQVTNWCAMLWWKCYTPLSIQSQAMSIGVLTIRPMQFPIIVLYICVLVSILVETCLAIVCHDQCLQINHLAKALRQAAYQLSVSTTTLSNVSLSLFTQLYAVIQDILTARGASDQMLTIVQQSGNVAAYGSSVRSCLISIFNLLQYAISTSSPGNNSI